MDGYPYEIMSYAQKVMGRWGSIINIKAKNLVTWANIPKTLSDKDSFEPADISTNEYDYLYNDWENYYFMNNSTFEQVKKKKYLIELNYLCKIEIKFFFKNLMEIQLM